MTYRPGEHVKEGDVLMELDNADLQLQLLGPGRQVSRGRRSVQRAATTSAITDPAVVDQLDVAREVRDSAKKQWEEKLNEFEKLTIVAPAAGTIIPPPARIDKISQPQGKLPTWEGTPFDERNMRRAAHADRSRSARSATRTRWTPC